MKYLKKALLLVFFLLLVGLDQWSKHYVVNNYELFQGRYELFESFPYLMIHPVANEGMIFGLFSDRYNQNENQFLLKNLIMGGISLLVLIIVSISYFKIPKKYLSLRIGFIMILAGAIGNLMDRFFGHLIFHGEWDFLYGKVIDFIYMQIPQYDLDWYIYNFADVFITMGAIVVTLTILFKHKSIMEDDKMFASKENSDEKNIKEKASRDDTFIQAEQHTNDIENTTSWFANPMDEQREEKNDP